MPAFSPAVLDHFHNPRNPGRLPAGVPGVQRGSARDDAHGDLVHIDLLVRESRVAEARFQACGCTSTIAAASLATELARGQSLARLLLIEAPDIAQPLELPRDKLHCAQVVAAALRRAATAIAEPGD